MWRTQSVRKRAVDTTTARAFDTTTVLAFQSARKGAFKNFQEACVHAVVVLTSTHAVAAVVVRSAMSSST
jgi:hypothetical protein